MGKLDSSRMTNATKVGRVDDVHNECEADLGEIFGIPDDTRITNPIFGITDDGSLPVNDDGTLKGTMRLVMSGVESDPAQAIGFEFDDGTEKKRLVYVDSGLKIYHWNTSTLSWDQISDLENPASGAGLLSSLSDVDVTTPLTADQVLAVNALGTKFELQAPTAGTGKNRFADLDDTPLAANPSPGDPFASTDVNRVVYVASESSLGFQDPPTGIGAPFAMMLRAPGGTGEFQEWGSTPKTYIPMYQWSYMSYADDGDLLVDDPLLITSGATRANEFITLDKGIYDIGFWFTCKTTSQWGRREWRVQGTYAEGPAAAGVNAQADVFYKPNLHLLGAHPGPTYLGHKTLLMIADGKINFQAKQDSGEKLTGCQFFASIVKVK